jgi:hypothetical protein
MACSESHCSRLPAAPERAAGNSCQPVERVRAIRDEIKAKVERLVEAEGWA